MDNIHDIIDQVTQEIEQDRRRIMIENYINRVAASLQTSVEGAVNVYSISEIKEWERANKSIFAYKVSEAAKIILRQELLGE